MPSPRLHLITGTGRDARRLKKASHSLLSFPGKNRGLFVPIAPRSASIPLRQLRGGGQPAVSACEHSQRRMLWTQTTQASEMTPSYPPILSGDLSRCAHRINREDDPRPRL